MNGPDQAVIEGLPELNRIHEHYRLECMKLGIGFPELETMRDLLMPRMADWKITWPGREEHQQGDPVPTSGVKYAISLGMSLIVRPANGFARTWIVMKNKMQPWMGERARNRRVLEAELNGVYLYVEGSKLILTDQKMAID